MRRIHGFQVFPGVVALAAGLACLTAAADVTIEEKVAMDGFGPTRIGAMEGTTSTAIATDRARIDSQIQFKSKLLKMFGGNGASAQIIRLDTDRQFDLEIKKKEYTELSFEDFRTNMKNALASADGKAADSAASAPSGSPINESQCEWSPAKAEVRRSGARAQLAGFDTEQATIVVTQTCTDKQTHAACDFVYSIDQWLSAAMPGGKQAQDFWMAYARKLGAGEMTSALQMRGQQVMSRYKDGWGEALKKASEVQGYPLKSTFTMQVGGPTCAQSSPDTMNTVQAAQPGQPGQPGVLPSAGDAAVEAGTNAAASVATQVVTQQAMEQAGGSVGGAIAGSAAGAFGGKLTSGLLNKMRKKPAEAEPAAASATAAAPAAGASMTQMFRMTSETTAVKDSAIPPAQFEVPAGFKKVSQ